MSGPTYPTFAVVGAARAGTTSLLAGLRAHPGIFVADPKEPHYFALHGSRPDFCGPGDDRFVNQVAVTVRDDYLGLYPSGSGYLALGEGSVSTMYYHQRAIPEMLQINPEMRVIVLLREPVSRAYSSFQYLRTVGCESHTDFLAAVDAEAARKAHNWHHLWHYTGMSMYAEAIEALQKALPPENFGVWFHDDLERDYSGTVSQVLQFLQIPAAPGVGEDVPRVNASGTPRIKSLQQAIWWASSQPVLRSTARGMTSWRFREAVRSRIIKRQSVPADVTQALGPWFSDDLARLRDLLSGDLPPWLLGKEQG